MTQRRVLPNRIFSGYFFTDRTHGSPFVSPSLVTERDLWSCGPLTSPMSSCVSALTTSCSHVP